MEEMEQEGVMQEQEGVMQEQEGVMHEQEGVMQVQEGVMQVQEGVMQVSGDGDHGGGDQGGGGEVVQVIMQDDGNIIMPEGQFIQVNTDDGQPQFIQVTDNNGENQLIQLMPDGQAHLVQVQEGPDGNTHIIQVAPASMDLGGDQGDLTIVNMGDAPPSDINQETEQTEQQMQLQMGCVDGESSQDVMGSVIINPEEESTLHLQTSDDISAEQEEQQQHMVIEHHTEPTQDTEETAQNQEYRKVSRRPKQTIITIHPKMDQHNGQAVVSQSASETMQEIMTSVACTTMSDINSVEDSPPRVAKAKSGVTTRVVASSESPAASSTDTHTSGNINAKPKVKKLDMTSPIPLTTETIVVVNGKRCVLRVDPQSSNLVAYPFTPTPIPGKRGRGRPRKVRPPEGSSPKYLPLLSPSGSQKSTASLDSESSQSASEMSFDTPTGTPTKKDGLSEQENSAAEGLLGLSEDGVRRSRRKRKRATFLSDYEMGAVEGVVDDDDEEEDSKEGILEGVKRPRGRPPSTTPKPQAATPNNAMQTLLMNMGFIPKKRGRGRPRRNPLPTAIPTNTGGIPTFIIQQPGGSAVMMSPMQTIEGFQKNLVNIRAKPAPQEIVLEKAQTPASIVIQNADGTETQIDTTPVEPALPPQEEGGDNVEEPIMTEIEDSVQPTEGDEIAAEEALKADNQEQEKEIMSKPVTDMLDSGALDDDVADPDYEPGGPIEEEDDDDLVEKDSPEPKKRKLSESSPSMPQPTIIQLPDNMVPLMIPKKTPVKIGLKATESDLEKLKCPKCDFQAYYQQQFQEHIATHIDDIHKCKCCNYLTFEKDGLLGHFRDAHPKCICPVCDFMAEHAYIIKRHMMRHSANGCECNLCGKRYKDQYILKMHLKMVHMPAEVLYECQVCTKKFTRKAHLKRHLRIHEPEKPFKCSHCDYRGCERSDITKHLLIHEEPRHVCEVCGKAFRHIKNKELHVKRHKGQRDYKCGVCDFYGYTFTDIRKHIERKHTDNRNILCDKCGSAFKNDMLLREHQKQQCELLMFEASLPVEEEVGTEADGQTIHHTIHVPHDQYVVDQAQVGADPHQQQQHIMVNGNQVNITVEQLDHLEGLTHHHHQEQLTGGEVTVVHMDDIQGAGDEELEEEELLEEEEQLEQQQLEQQGLEEDLTIEEEQVQEEEVAVAGIVSSMAEDVHIITVSPEDAQEQGLVVEMGEGDMGQVVYEQQVIEQEVIEQQVMEHHDMNQQMDEEAIGEQLLIELVQ